MIRHTFEGETANFILIRWFLTTAPLTAASGYVTGSGLGVQEGTTVTQVYYPAPYDQQSLIIEDLAPGVYDVKSYRSADGVTPDEEIFTLAMSADVRSVYSTETLTYIVDRGESGTDPNWEDPSFGDIGIRDERLFEKSYEVYERSTGRLLPPSESTPEWEDKSDEGGGFDFTIPDKVFESGAIYWVTIYNRVDATEGSGSGSGSGSEVSDVVIIDEDTDFDVDTMNSKLIYADGPDTDIITLSFADLATLGDCNFKISTHGGLQAYLAIQLDAGDIMRFKGEDWNVLYLGKGEELSLMIRSNVIYVLPGSVTGYERLGQRIWGDKLEANTLYRDGTLYQQADQPRLMQFIETLPGASVVTEAAWLTDKSKFARDDGAGTIRVPDSRTKFIRAVSAVDGSVVPGISQTDLIKQFWTGTFTTLNILKVDGTNTEIGTDPNVGNPNIRTGVEVDQTLFGSETRPVNESLLPLLCV